ncbi:Adaptor protein complex 4 (AP-4), sigma subunit [Blattamonas nauphoetae]|uniref:AP complex subunit sigma n=1 Tax=Blattamonas nauphoetae TaxID=2049346 RepID=A0ABQ9YME9_9EUKA|nr:Adaptor protein complex 4 (AP-4), sigma subunit [Blattamonas nauphoetae]
MIHFFLVVNKFGTTRLTQYYNHLTMQERVALEGEIIRQCLSLNDNQCPFFDYSNYRIIFKRFASLYFIVGTSDEEIELEMIELIQLFVETLDYYFESVCEFDIMANLDRVHFILNEMIANGHVVSTGRKEILEPVDFLDRASP